MELYFNFIRKGNGTQGQFQRNNSETSNQENKKDEIDDSEKLKKEVLESKQFEEDKFDKSNLTEYEGHSPDNMIKTATSFMKFNTDKACKYTLTYYIDSLYAVIF